jgi:hypothetical protein
VLVSTRSRSTSGRLGGRGGLFGVAVVVVLGGFLASALTLSRLWLRTTCRGSLTAGLAACALAGD